MTGAIPRRPEAAVVVALQQVDGAITAMAVFYVGVTGGRNARVVTPRHHAVPRRGWVGAGRLLGPALAAHPLRTELLALMRSFTATTYAGALLLQSLAPRGYPASRTASDTTMNNYHNNLRAYESPPALAKLATRSQHVCPFMRGERVFAQLDGIWHEATIAMVHRDGTLSVTYVDAALQADDANAARKPEAEVRPDIVHAEEGGAAAASGGPSGAHAKDPEETVDETPSRITEHLALSGGTDRASPTGLTFLDRLGELGEYTALIEAIFGHEDHFGNETGQLIENKFLIPRGPTHPTARLSYAVVQPALPPASLAMPRFKVATVIGAMQDVELHELHGVFHAGPTQSAEWLTSPEVGSSSAGEVATEEAGEAVTEEAGGLSQGKKVLKRRKKRAERSALQAATYTSPRMCWFRDPDDADGRLCVHGVGVADWLSRFY